MTGLPPGWTEAALDDVVEVFDSRRVPVNGTERAKRPGPVPYYGATGQVGWIDEALFDEELLLLGEDAAPFLDSHKPKAYVISGPSWVNNHAHVLRARETSFNRFLKYALDALDYHGHVTGTTRLKLTQAAMRKLRVPLPPLDEQRRIVDAIEEQFSRLDDAESSLRRASQSARRLQQAVLARALVGDWPLRPLSELILALRNGVFVSRPGTEPPGIPILRISAVRPMSLDVDDFRFAEIDESKASRYFVEEGDLLFTRYSGNPDFVGACARVPRLAHRRLHPDKLIRVVVNRDLVDPGFVELAVSTGNGRRQIEERLKTTAGQVGIAGGQLKSVLIPVPPLEKQNQLVAQVDACHIGVDAMEYQIERALMRCQALRRAVLREALGGRLGTAVEPVRTLSATA
jgi:type I restriction enzyme, S subunit